MKRFKLIVKFFFEQKCKEIWKFVKTLPTIFMCISFLSLVAGILLILCTFIGYCFFLIAPSLKPDKDYYDCCAGMGIVILIFSTFTFCVIYSFVSWIKENIVLAKERADEEFGFSSTSNIIDKKVKHNGK